jgi:hypothetical protein
MASTYINDLRLNEMATGDGSGTWGTTTNTNLELIAEAFSYGTEVITTNADTHTTTIADGATDPGRSLYLKYTGTLDSACTITIGPNTVSKVWIIENGTSGSQNIILSQGSGANITIPAGDTKVVYSDGAGAGAAFFDAFASLSVVDLKVQDDLTVTDDASIGGDATITGTLGVTGNITGTLATAAQPNITSVGTLTALTGGTGDLNWDSGTLFVDSSANNVGIGTSSPAAPLSIEGSSTGEYDALILRNSNAAASGQSAAMIFEVSSGTSGTEAASVAKISGLRTGSGSTGDLLFHTTNAGVSAEAMRIDSVGTTSIKTDGTTQLILNRADASIQATNQVAQILVTGDDPSASQSGAAISFIAEDAWATNSYPTNITFSNDLSGTLTERMRIDSSGNLLLNTTSSPTTTKAIISSDYSAAGTTNTGLTITGRQGGNWYNNGIHALGSSGLVFSTGTTGVNGADATNERVRIDSSGNFMVGKTAINTDSVGFEARAIGLNAMVRDGGETLVLGRNTSDGSILSFRKDGAVVGSIGTGASELFIGSNDAYLWTSGNNDAFLPASTVIGGASDGLLDLGSSSRYFKDLYLVKLDLAGGSSLDGNYAFLKSSSATVASLTLRKDSIAADSVDYLQCRNDGNTLKLVIEGDGDVKNANNSYGAISDEKLKENIVDATSQWDDIKAVRVRKYSLKEHDLDSPNMLGVVAQELESAGMNGLVSESIDRNEDNEDLGTVTKSVNYSILYMKAVKALQEAMDRIETLEAKVETLENA